MRSRAIVVLITAVALSSTACGGGDEPAEQAQTPPVAAPAPSQPDSAALAATRRAEQERVRGVIGEMINFDFDRSNIRSDAQPVLARKVEVLRDNPSYRIRIEGHCDARGSDAYNRRLGARRAAAVRQYLVERGIDASRLETASLGEQRALDTRRTREGWARNRRAEFHVIAGPGV